MKNEKEKEEGGLQKQFKDEFLGPLGLVREEPGTNKKRLTTIRKEVLVDRSRRKQN